MHPLRECEHGFERQARVLTEQPAVGVRVQVQIGQLQEPDGTRSAIGGVGSVSGLGAGLGHGRLRFGVARLKRPWPGLLASLAGIGKSQRSRFRYDLE